MVKQLAENYFKIPFHEPPAKYRTWVPSICKKLKAIKYTNPSHPREYIVIVHQYKTGAVQCIYHSPAGYDFVDWFAEFVPLICLEDQWRMLRQKTNFSNQPVDFRIKPYRSLFTKHINETINPKYPDLDPSIIRIIHALFDIYLPFMSGICSKCFQVSFPEKGQGIRYLNKISPDTFFDIKLSPPKPDGFAPQQMIYITNTLQIGGQRIYIDWRPWIDVEPLF